MSSQRRILFDVLGTLVHDPFHVEMPAFFGLSFKQLLAAKHPTRWVEFELGAIDEGRMLTDFFADGRAYDHAGLMQSMRSAYRWLDGMQDIVRELSRSHELHTCSNYPCWSSWIEQELQLGRYLSWTFVSWQLGVRKPDALFFERVLEQLGGAVDDIIFVDDRAENCAAAGAAGIDAILFESANQLRAALAERAVV